MDRYCLAEMVGGWFIGNFEPVAMQSEHCEVAVKRYKAGDKEAWHWQESAYEVTAVISGEVRIGSQYLHTDDVIVLAPGLSDAASFEALTDATLVAVKSPSRPSDKRIAPRVEGGSAECLTS